MANEPAVQQPVPVQQTVAPEPEWQPRSINEQTRYTPPAPLGTGFQLSGFQLAELGAMLNAMGAEKGTATALMHNVQALAIKVVMEALPGLLADLHNVHKAKINRLMQEIQAAPGVLVTSQQNWRDRIAGVQAASVEYISKEMVLRLIAMAGERNTQIT
jgi:hypothetical protein